MESSKYLANINNANRQSLILGLLYTFSLITIYMELNVQKKKEMGDKVFGISFKKYCPIIHGIYSNCMNFPLALSKQQKTEDKENRNRHSSTNTSYYIQMFLKEHKQQINFSSFLIVPLLFP